MKWQWSIFIIILPVGAGKSSLGSFENDFRKLRVRELKYRLRKHYGIVPQNILDKNELVKILVTAEMNAIRSKLEHSSTEKNEQFFFDSASVIWSKSIITAFVVFIGFLFLINRSFGKVVTANVKIWAIRRQSHFVRWSILRRRQILKAVDAGYLLSPFLILLVLLVVAIDLLTTLTSTLLATRLITRTLGFSSRDKSKMGAVLTLMEWATTWIPSLPLAILPPSDMPRAQGFSLDLGPMAAMYALRSAQQALGQQVLTWMPVPMDQETTAHEGGDDNIDDDDDNDNDHDNDHDDDGNDNDDDIDDDDIDDDEVGEDSSDSNKYSTHSTSGFEGRYNFCYDRCFDDSGLGKSSSGNANGPSGGLSEID
jgi:hypothetical protein